MTASIVGDVGLVGWEPYPPIPVLLEPRVLPSPLSTPNSPPHSRRLSPTSPSRRRSPSRPPESIEPHVRVQWQSPSPPPEFSGRSGANRRATNKKDSRSRREQSQRRGETMVGGGQASAAETRKSGRGDAGRMRCGSGALDRAAHPRHPSPCLHPSGCLQRRTR